MGQKRCCWPGCQPKWMIRSLVQNYYVIFSTIKIFFWQKAKYLIILRISCKIKQNKRQTNNLMTIERPDRVGVELKDLREMVSHEVSISGNSMSQEIRALIKEALKMRYKNRTLAEIISAFDVSDFSKKTGLKVERLAELACEADAPTFSELIKIASNLPLSAIELVHTSTLTPTKKQKNETKR